MKKGWRKNGYIGGLTPALAEQPEKGEAVIIGIVGPTSGSVAYYGTLMWEGGLLATQEINDAGGVRIGDKMLPLKAIAKDDRSTPADSVAAVEEFITQDKVHMIIGPLDSSCALADVEVVERYGIVQLVPIAVADAITQDHPWVFRNCANQTMQTSRIAYWAMSNPDYQTFAMLLENTDYGWGAGEIFSEVAEEASKEIVATEYFDLGSTDFTTQLTEINAKDPDAVFLVGFVMEGSQILKQATELGLEVQWFGLGGFASNKFIELAGEAAEGMIHVSYWEPNPDIPQSMTFAEAFPAFSSMEADMFSAATYDAVYIAKEAFEAADCASQESECQEALREAMQGIDFMGVQGRTYFDEQGQGQLCFYIVRIEEGKRNIIDYVCPEEVEEEAAAPKAEEAEETSM